MLKTVKNIRKLYNAKLLFISSDVTVKETLEKEFDDYFKELKFVTNNHEAIKLASANSYDLVVVDTMTEGMSFAELCSELSDVAPTLPKIIISNDDDSDHIVTAINKLCIYVYLKTSKTERY